MIAIIGCDSLIGNYLMKLFGAESIGFTRRSNLSAGLFYDLEIGDTSIFDELKISEVIICAGITNIEICEKFAEQTHKVNCLSIGRLVKYFNSRNIPVIGFSSNSVFGVYKTAPNEESKSFAPTCRYAEQKLITDNLMLSSSNKNSVIRLTKVVSLNGIFKEIYHLSKYGGELTLFKNLNFSPISLAYIGGVVKKIVEGNCSGVFHLSGSKTYSYYDFGQEILERLSNKNIEASISPALSNQNYYYPDCAELDMTYTKLKLDIVEQGIGSLCADIFDNHSSLVD